MIHIPACVVAVAPGGGRVRRLVDLDTSVERGETVAVLQTPTGQTPVTAPAPGRIAGVLSPVEKTVDEGEGIVWLHRD